MRILFITSQITDSGGVSSILSKKANALVQLYNCEVAIASTNDSNSSMFFHLNVAIDIIFLKTEMTSFHKLYQFKKEIQNIVNIFKPTIISVADNGLKSFFLKQFIEKEIKVVYEIHGNETSFYKGDVKGVKAFIRKKILNYYLPKFDAVIVQKKGFKLPKSNQLVSYIPNFIGTYQQKSLEDKNKIVAVGRIVNSKNYHGLIRIWNEIHKIHPQKKLHIYGSWNDEILTKRLKDQPNIILHQPVKDLNEIYGDASLFLHASYIESFPMVFLEAMTFGVPIVCFDINQPNIVLDKKNGFVIKLHDYNKFVEKVLVLLKDDVLRNKFSINAMKRSKNFSEEKVVKEWMKLYQKI